MIVAILSKNIKSMLPYHLLIALFRQQSVKRMLNRRKGKGKKRVGGKSVGGRRNRVIVNEKTGGEIKKQEQDQY